MLNNREIYSTDLPHRAVAVYMYLRDRADKDGTCYPAISTIAQDLKISKSTVKRALSELEKEGYIRHERRYRQTGGNSSNIYYVTRPP
ncbi:MAG TPA: helix-turn-helix domain-containing protein [Ruminococcaceae bacterium]|nr:helix-turn-helix domain-containing protein [Oscillospiraceae bacterium]